MAAQARMYTPCTHMEELEHADQLIDRLVSEIEELRRLRVAQPIGGMQRKMMLSFLEWVDDPSNPYRLRSDEEAVDHAELLEHFFAHLQNGGGEGLMHPRPARERP